MEVTRARSSCTRRCKIWDLSEVKFLVLETATRCCTHTKVVWIWAHREYKIWCLSKLYEPISDRHIRPPNRVYNDFRKVFESTPNHQRTTYLCIVESSKVYYTSLSTVSRETWMLLIPEILRLLGNLPVEITIIQSLIKSFKKFVQICQGLVDPTTEYVEISKGILLRSR